MRATRAATKGKFNLVSPFQLDIIFELFDDDGAYFQANPCFSLTDLIRQRFVGRWRIYWCDGEASIQWFTSAAWPWDVRSLLTCVLLHEKNPSHLNFWIDPIKYLSQGSALCRPRDQQLTPEFDSASPELWRVSATGTPCFLTLLYCIRFAIEIV